MTADRLEFGGNGRAGNVVFTFTQFDLEFGNDAIISFSLVGSSGLNILECLVTSPGRLEIFKYAPGSHCM
jgi:hypothetical protein